MKILEVFKGFALGFALVVIGIAIIIFGSLSISSSASIGGVVFIGPIPIVFGGGPGSGLLVLIALVAAIGMIMVLYITFALRRRSATGLT